MVTYTQKSEQWLHVADYEVVLHSLIEEKVDERRILFVDVAYRNTVQGPLTCRHDQWVLFDRDGYTYDPVRDFTPITNVVETAFLLLVHPALNAANPRELVALAKARPGQLAYASFGPASSAHLAGELLSISAGIRMVHVPYKGSAAAVTDLIAGQTQLMFDSLQSSLTHVRSKRLRAIAYAGPKRSRAVADVPTMAEAGFPEVIAGSWYGVLAPANTPQAIVTKLHTEIVRAANAPDVRERLENVGVDIIATTPQVFAAAIKSDLDRWSRVVKQANIKLD
jgi:tripartite-type tricarboxylate transporter receptor subunit TctC